MDSAFVPQLAVFAALGIAAGLWLLARGLGGYRLATRISDTSTSSIAAVAAGEVRISGRVEAAEVTLVSPLQSVACVYYRASIRGEDDVPGVPDDFVEERAVGFRVRDESGDIRVFPRGARWDAPTRFDDGTGSFGEEPAGLDLRTGSAIGLAEPDRATAVAALLSIRPPDDDLTHPLLRGARSGGRRRYREARLAVGDPVTVVGRALPFGDLADPAESDVALGSELPPDDPEVAANIAEARAAGILLNDPAEAWGNAAIPGFGIGRPTREPELDAEADRPVIASVEEAARAARTFDIAPETLVIASAPDIPLVIAHGVPGAAVERHENRFILGLLGGVLAIASAVAFAVMLAGGSGR